MSGLAGPWMDDSGVMRCPKCGLLFEPPQNPQFLECRVCQWSGHPTQAVQIDRNEPDDLGEILDGSGEETI